jgi:hypothetical protein
MARLFYLTMIATLRADVDAQRHGVCILGERWGGRRPPTQHAQLPNTLWRLPTHLSHIRAPQTFWARAKSPSPPHLTHPPPPSV